MLALGKVIKCEIVHTPAEYEPNVSGLYPVLDRAASLNTVKFRPPQLYAQAGIPVGSESMCSLQIPGPGLACTHTSMLHASLRAR